MQNLAFTINPWLGTIGQVINGESENFEDETADTIFASAPEFADVELAALRAERSRLRAELASRTEAWRVALRDLSDAQAELAELKGEIPASTPTPMSEGDWVLISGPDATDTGPEMSQDPL